MATTSDVLIDAFDRARLAALGALDGLDEAELTARIDGTANPVGWLVWHLVRVQDDHVADLAGAEQRWSAGGWVGRFGLPYAPRDTGYGHSSAQVDAFAGVPATLLAEYLAEVHAATVAYLRTVDAEELDRVVDEGWDPPVTAGARLVSVLEDCIQHAGQALFVRGVIGRRD